MGYNHNITLSVESVRAIAGGHGTDMIVEFMLPVKIQEFAAYVNTKNKAGMEEVFGELSALMQIVNDLGEQPAQVEAPTRIEAPAQTEQYTQTTEYNQTIEGAQADEGSMAAASEAYGVGTPVAEATSTDGQANTYNSYNATPGQTGYGVPAADAYGYAAPPSYPPVTSGYNGQ